MQLTEGVIRRYHSQRSPNRVFVLMPFAKSFDGVYATLQQCCADLGFDCVRADDDKAPGRITEKVLRGIIGADVIIADMTGRNANVFYELGLAHAISDRVVLLTQSSADVPFDLTDWSYIEYENTIGGGTRLAAELSKALTTLAASQEARAKTNSAAVPPKKVADGLPGDLGLLHLQADAEKRSGNTTRARELLEHALALAHSGIGTAGEVGNCAIEAESGGFLDLAEPLYQEAIRRDPAHVNNRQAYVSFLLDNREQDPEARSTARDYLDALEKEPVRQFRTTALRLQLSLIENSSPPDMEAFLKRALSSLNSVSPGEAMHLMTIAGRAKRPDIVDEIARHLDSKVSVDDRRRLLRMHADALAGSRDDDAQRRALKMYEELAADLRSEGEVDPDMFHNMATVIYDLEVDDWSNRALEAWRIAYAGMPEDTRIRKAFSGFLLRTGRPKEAQRVLKGEPLDA